MPSGPPVVGIDLASRGRPLGVAVLDRDGRIVELARAPFDDEALLALPDRYGATLVGIDSPLALPPGYCCLDPACACHTGDGVALRPSEVALRTIGIGCFMTNKRTIIRSMIERGLELHALFASRGVRAVEVFPYATKVRLFGRPPRGHRKTTAAGRAWLADLLGPLLGIVLPAGLHDDLGDALLAAYTALLVQRGEAESLGDEPDGGIWLPRLPAPANP